MRSRILLVAAAIVLASAMSAQATMWDAYTGFNSTSNTATDLWQYMASPQGANSGYVLLPSYASFPGDMPGNAWQPNGSFPGIGAVSREIRVHPDMPALWNSAAVIGWNSPVSGNVDVSFLVTDRNAGATPTDPPTWDGVTYNLFKAGDVTALSSGYVANGGNSGTINVPNVAVSVGTMLYLQIGPGTMNHWYDLTGVNFTISEVPEPASVILLGCALIGLLAYAWRKR